MADNKTDLKTQIVQQSGADIYVEAEMNVLLSGSGNSVKIILTAYEISTGNSLANKVGESNKFYTDDIIRFCVFYASRDSLLQKRRRNSRYSTA